MSLVNIKKIHVKLCQASQSSYENTENLDAFESKIRDYYRINNIPHLKLEKKSAPQADRIKAMRRSTTLLIILAVFTKKFAAKVKRDSDRPKTTQVAMKSTNAAKNISAVREALVAITGQYHTPSISVKAPNPEPTFDDPVTLMAACFQVVFAMIPADHSTAHLALRKCMKITRGFTRLPDMAVLNNVLTDLTNGLQAVVDINEDITYRLGMDAQWRKSPYGKKALWDLEKNQALISSFKITCRQHGKALEKRIKNELISSGGTYIDFDFLGTRMNTSDSQLLRNHLGDQLVRFILSQRDLYIDEVIFPREVSRRKRLIKAFQVKHAKGLN